LRRAFILFDVNRDGKITESELSSVLGFLGINADQDEVHRMIEDADINGELTTNSLISPYSLFLCVCKSHTSLLTVKTIHSLGYCFLLPTTDQLILNLLVRN
ncbi:hypothetical protein Ciccas_005457, partial [Cichlidogyrus casuarinus]